MTIQLYNTRTRQKEEFKPLDKNNVRMYVCGPTVYDRAHIGNARAVVVFDVLYRLLRHEYPKVTYARNITDVDDKIIAAANERGISIEALTTETTKFFHDDMGALNCLTPDVEPRATTHIPQMIAMIQKLIDSNHAYAAEGHVLFAVESYENYGKLSGRSRDEMIAGARVEVAPYKKNAGDFVLWKPAKDGEQSFDSPWGKGRPGWHIECSAMSTQYLGETFDIHGGGADLMFPHHENEIAQSVCSNPNSEFARYWIHNGFLTVNGEKMSKSLGNFITVKDLLSDIRTNHPAAIRYALLATHYSKPLDWNQKSFEDAQNAILRFTEALNTLMTKTAFGKAADGVWGSALRAKIQAEPSKEFMDALRDDMNTPKAFAELHALCKEINKAKNTDELEKYGRAFIGCLDQVGLMSNSLSFFPIKPMEETLPTEEVRHLDIKRKEAKKAKNFQEADKIRDEIKALGYTPIDKPDGTTEWRKA